MMPLQMNSYNKNNMENKEIKIRLKNINKAFGKNKVLDDISIDLYEGELVTLIGPSGCGKSTIFNIISNLTSVDSGEVEIKSEISYMHQKDLLLTYKTIMDNVTLPLIIKNMNKKNAYKIAEEYIPIFGLRGYEKMYPKDLSGGMRQRANFLRTFLCSNELMLLDEPFGSLDYITKSELHEWFLDVRKNINTSILLISHDIDEAIKLSDRIYVLSQKPAKIKKEFDLKNTNFDKSSIEYCSKLKEQILNNLK